MTDILKLYNPANASALTSEQIAGLRNLTTEDLKELAKAYPNKIFNRGYLLIIDSKSKLPVEKQLPALSTFENLLNLREKNNFKSFVAIGFAGQAKQIVSKTVKPRNSQVIDLSDTELMSLPGFKTAPNGQGKQTVIPPQTVRVTKVKKIKSNG